VTTLEQAAARFGVQVIRELHPGVAAVSGGAVLKLDAPERETEHSADALRFWDGDGAARLLDHAPDLRAVLLEHVRPGDRLWSVADDDEATLAAAGVLRRLWKHPAGRLPFRTLAEECEHWSRATSLPPHWRALVRSQDEQVVCHQDLHGGNVLLDAERGWVAIDPKPLLGERAFDVASLIRDRRPVTLETIRRRTNLLCAELDLDRERVRGWGIIHALAWGHPRVAQLIAAA
jgi:streptomycin 6-kinase